MNKEIKITKKNGKLTFKALEKILIKAFKKDETEHLIVLRICCKEISKLAKTFLKYKHQSLDLGEIVIRLDAYVDRNTNNDIVLIIAINDLHFLADNLNVGINRLEFEPKKIDSVK